MKKSIILFVLFSLLSFFCNESCAQTPDWLWAKSAGGTNHDYAYSVSVDVLGNAYVTGAFGSQTITFGSYTLTNAGYMNIFIVKYDNSGNVLWAKSAGGTEHDRGWSVSVDASGNAYVTGTFTSQTITFGSYTLTNTSVYDFDIFIAKYDSSGNVLWAKSAGGTKMDVGTSVSVDPSGNAYLTGYFHSSTITFDTCTLTNKNPYNSDVFLAKYDSSGNILWAKRGGGTMDDVARAVSADASGNIYLTGGFYGSYITFGSFTLTSKGYSDMYLVKYDAGGNVLWAKSAGGTDYDNGYSVSFDVSGNAYVTGEFKSPIITFGSYTLTNGGYSNIFLTKYNSSGTVLWAKSAGGTGDDSGQSVTVDSSGNAYITGFFSSQPVTFGSFTLTSMGERDIYLVKYDSGGNVLWAKSAGGTDDDYGSSVSVDASGNAYLTGYFSSPTITFDSFTLTNVMADYYYDQFLAKLESIFVGIDKFKNSLNISVYPNPATEKIMVVLPKDKNGSYITIYNIEGEELLRQEIKEQITTIEVRELKSGIYVIKVIGWKGVQVGKFMKNIRN